MKDLRPSRDQTGLALTFIFAQRATCIRRQAGALLVDEGFRMLGGGYNGLHPGAPHCTTHPCPGANLPSGTGLDACEAIHAEQNALMYCIDVRRIHTAYTTCSPCIQCTKLLLGTSCQRIVFCDPYPHSDAQQLWLKDQREWLQVPYEEVEKWLMKLQRSS